MEKLSLKSLAEIAKTIEKYTTVVNSVVAITLNPEPYSNIQEELIKEFSDAPATQSAENAQGAQMTVKHGATTFVIAVTNNNLSTPVDKVAASAN